SRRTSAARAASPSSPSTSSGSAITPPTSRRWSSSCARASTSGTPRPRISSGAISERGTPARGLRPSVVPVRRLARLDPQRQPVLLRRQGAGGVGGEGARRGVGLVEVEDDLPVLREVGVEEPAGRIGLLVARLVPEYVEQLHSTRLLEDRLEPEVAPAQAE